ncbi:MAG: hypothetical protein EXR72_08080 [Myxococcales bacterium]|nr:hypothetical protein [Myxococcales bacterium]
MKELNAVALRQSLARVARALERDREPILLRLGRKPVGVIVSIRDFEERFASARASDRRRALVDEILADRPRGSVLVDEALADLRGR